MFGKRRPGGGGNGENIGHRDGAVQEPLELHELGAPGADGRRAQRDRVHAVPGRRPGKLHGSGHVRRLPHKDCRHERRVRQGLLRQPVQADIEPGHVQQVRLRDSPEERAAGRHAAGGRFRRDRRRTRSGVGLCDVRGDWHAPAVDILRAVSSDVFRRSQHRRRRAQPGRRVLDVRRFRRTEDVRPKVHQHPCVFVRQCRGHVPGIRAQDSRSETFRPERASSAVVGVLERPFH